MSNALLIHLGGDPYNGVVSIAAHDEFLEARKDLATHLLKTDPINTGKWQTLDISQSGAHATYELLNVSLWYDMPNSRGGAQEYIKPDLPWAERHFQERIGGKAINPGEEHANWPYHNGQVQLHQNGGKYDHNYMERFWPTDLKDGFSVFPNKYWHGYRFKIGDLNDLIEQLRRDPGTRQAYLPVWFPEDTGATAGQRVPCTLGYHFIVREGVLHCQYNLRSCEIYRHFTNDIYMAVRLAQHVGKSIGVRDMGRLTTNIVSFHGFVGDRERIEEMANG